MGWDLCAGLLYEHRFAMLIKGIGVKLAMFKLMMVLKMLLKGFALKELKVNLIFSAVARVLDSFGRTRKVSEFQTKLKIAVCFKLKQVN